jgi:hypothetical protein
MRPYLVFQEDEIGWLAPGALLDPSINYFDTKKGLVSKDADVS